jgi:purine-cytosine permease-like protein
MFASKQQKKNITITQRMWYCVILNLSTFTANAISQYGATLHTQQF